MSKLIFPALIAAALAIPAFAQTHAGGGAATAMRGMPTTRPTVESTAPLIRANAIVRSNANDSVAASAVRDDGADCYAATGTHICRQDDDVRADAAQAGPNVIDHGATSAHVTGGVSDIAIQGNIGANATASHTANAVKAAANVRSTASASVPLSIGIRSNAVSASRNAVNASPKVVRVNRHRAASATGGTQ